MAEDRLILTGITIQEDWGTKLRVGSALSLLVGAKVCSGNPGSYATWLLTTTNS